MGDMYRGSVFVKADSADDVIDLVEDWVARGGGELVDHRTYAIEYDPPADEPHIGDPDSKHWYKVNVTSRQT